MDNFTEFKNQIEYFKNLKINYESLSMKYNLDK